MMAILHNLGSDLLNDILEIPMDPSQRFYWVTLLSSLLFALIILPISLGPKRAWSQLCTKLFNKKTLLHPSSKLDFKIFIFNLFFKSIILAPVLGGAFALSILILKTLRALFPQFEGWIHLSALSASVIYTLLFFLLSDFLRFFHHYCMHRISILRHFHRLHHSAEVLTPLTLLRAHPVEVVFAQFRNLMTYSLSLSLSVFLFPQSISGLDILGVNIFGMLFNLLGSNLRHSAIALSFGPLEYLFISPRMHQLHHSKDKDHYSKNLGVSLSIWDYLTGSFYRPSKEEECHLNFGIKDASSEESRNFKEAMLRPFKTFLKFNF